MRRLCIGIGIVLSLVWGFAGAASPARAECIYGLAYVERENAETVWLLGPDPCIHPTSWNQVVFVGPVDVGHDMPDGAPNRVYVEVRVPIP